jgi:hypothetical protein
MGKKDAFTLLLLCFTLLYGDALVDIVRMSTLSHKILSLRMMCFPTVRYISQNLIMTHPLMMTMVGCRLPFRT